jgi:hypothetical protein
MNLRELNQTCIVMKKTKRALRQAPEPSAKPSPVIVVMKEEDVVNEQIHAAKGSYDTDLTYSVELSTALEINERGIKELTSPLSG